MSINSQPDSVVTAIDTEGHTAPPIFKLAIDEYGFIMVDSYIITFNAAPIRISAITQKNNPKIRRTTWRN